MPRSARTRSTSANALGIHAIARFGRFAPGPTPPSARVNGVLAIRANLWLKLPRPGSSGSATSRAAASATTSNAASSAPRAAISRTRARHHARRCVGKSNSVTARAKASRAGERSVLANPADRRSASAPKLSRARWYSGCVAEGYDAASVSRGATTASPPGPGTSRRESICGVHSRNNQDATRGKRRENSSAEASEPAASASPDAARSDPPRRMARTRGMRCLARGVPAAPPASANMACRTSVGSTPSGWIASSEPESVSSSSVPRGGFAAAAAAAAAFDSRDVATASQKSARRRDAFAARRAAFADPSRVARATARA